MSIDPYEVLGVDRRATTHEIKRAWRAKSAKHHPDIGGCGEEMRKVNAAHEILSDPERRARYDETGDTDGQLSDPLTEAERTLIQIAEACVAGLQPGQDLIAIIRQEIWRNQSEFKQKLPKARAEAARWKDEVVRCTADKNLIAGLLESRAAVAARRVEEMEKAIALGDAMIALLVTYVHQPAKVEKKTAAPRVRRAADSIFWPSVEAEQEVS